MNKKEYLEHSKTIMILVLLLMIILMNGVFLNMLNVCVTSWMGMIILSFFWYYHTIKLAVKSAKGELK